MADLYYSIRCPDCLRENDPPAERCRHCGQSTSWPGIEDYRDYMLRLRRRAMIHFLAGAGVAFVGLVFITALLVSATEILTRSPLVIALCCMLMLMCLGTVGVGFWQLGRARRQLLFE